MFSSTSLIQYSIFLLIANAVYVFIWMVLNKSKLHVLSGVGKFRIVSLHGEGQLDEVMTTA